MALSKTNDTPAMEFSDFTYKQKGSTTCYGGGLVVAASDGYAKPGVAAASLRILGVAREDSVNAGADGAASVIVVGPVAPNGKRRLFKFANDETTPLTQADVGASAYIKDDFTFSGDGTSRTAGGKLRQVDSDGVWIELAT